MYDLLHRGACLARLGELVDLGQQSLDRHVHDRYRCPGTMSLYQEGRLSKSILLMVVRHENCASHDSHRDRAVRSRVDLEDPWLHVQASVVVVWVFFPCARIRDRGLALVPGRDLLSRNCVYCVLGRLARCSMEAHFEVACLRRDL